MEKMFLFHVSVIALLKTSASHVRSGKDSYFSHSFCQKTLLPASLPPGQFVVLLNIVCISIVQVPSKRPKFIPTWQLVWWYVKWVYIGLRPFLRELSAHVTPAPALEVSEEGAEWDLESEMPSCTNKRNVLRSESGISRILLQWAYFIDIL